MEYFDVMLAKALSGSGGGGGEPVIEALSVTENGTYTAPSGVDGYSPVTVNVSGGGGLEFETGTFKQNNGVTGPPDHAVQFTNQHSKPPAVILLASIDETAVTNQYIETWEFVDWWQLFSGKIMIQGSTMGYSSVTGLRGTSGSANTAYSLSVTAHSSSETDDTDETCSRYFAKPDSFFPYADVFKYGRTLTYKWIAIWI
jgi:hypothetical protein